jgi:hypothetical protein
LIFIAISWDEASYRENRTMNSVGLGLIVSIAAAISAGIILALLPWLQRHALAHPNSRSSHLKSTPQGGGYAVIVAAIGVAAGVVAFGLNEPSFGHGSLWLVLASTAFIAAVRAVDDMRTIEVAPRLLLQTLAVGIMIASLPTELRVVPMLPWWIERAVLLFACLWFVNLTNFMDGIDWMTVVEFVPVAIGLTIIGLLGALPMHGVVVALALCGASTPDDHKLIDRCLAEGGRASFAARFLQAKGVPWAAEPTAPMLTRGAARGLRRLSLFLERLQPPVLRPAGAGWNPACLYRR